MGCCISFNPLCKVKNNWNSTKILFVLEFRMLGIRLYLKWEFLFVCKLELDQIYENHHQKRQFSFFQKKDSINLLKETK